MFSLPLATFPHVTLDELNENAEMLTRIDRKYVLDRDGAEAFVRALDPRIRVLEIDGRRQSAYETVYFDTPDLLSYRMSAQSRRVRIKVRTRTYVESRTSFLEVKTRGGNDVTVKDRIGYQWIRRGALSEEGRAFASDAFDMLGQRAERADDLHVAITTRYRRATLLAPDDGRITIDTDLSWMLPDGRSLDLPGLVIVETKSRSAATDVDRLLWRARCRPQPVSKFATGLAALRPELPHNRWARLLRGPFTPETSKEQLCAAV